VNGACVSVMLAMAASVHRGVTLQDVGATGDCPRWSCPCVELARRVSKRHDATSHFRRTALSAARQALRLTQNVLQRIVSYASRHNACIYGSGLLYRY